MSHDVRLDIYEGPLDLLLHLIQKNDLDIYDIPISQITSEYLHYIDLLKEMRLDLAGEFLVMAATLMQIKARTLLPAPSTEGEEGPDPRAELISRLLEYQRYKEAAKVLDQRLQSNKEVHYRGAPVFSEEDYSLDASLFDLLDALRDVLKELKPDVREILYEEIPIEVKIRDILSFLESRAFATFREILSRENTRHGLIVTFLAILELIRLKQIVARQPETFGEIRVYRSEATADISLIEETPAPESEVLPQPAAKPRFWEGRSSGSDSAPSVETPEAGGADAPPPPSGPSSGNETKSPQEDESGR
jgi:segregation and condensation protein A